MNNLLMLLERTEIGPHVQNSAHADNSLSSWPY